jgi:hypothetical protein
LRQAKKSLPQEFNAPDYFIINMFLKARFQLTAGFHRPIFTGKKTGIESLGTIQAIKNLPLAAFVEFLPD